MTDTAISIGSQLETNKSQRFAALFQIFGGSLFIAVLAQVQIPLFFSPVPLSLQTLAVMLVAGCLGRVKGTSAVLAYLAQLSLGLPVASGGAISPHALMGPTGGYLLGFILIAYLVGWCSDRRHRMPRFTFPLALFSVLVLQLGIGTVWLAAFTGFKNAVFMGFFPFIIGELLKSVAAAACILRWRSS